MAISTKKPIISICIPTYNRSSYLRNCIESILICVEDRREEVEVIISDNASTDNTREIAEKYVEKYDFIKYFRNQTNIEDENYPMAISRASGIFRKLINDTSLLSKDSIQYMLAAVTANMNSKPVIFFSNKNKSENTELNPEHLTLRKFVAENSYFITWIGSFGIWESHFNAIENKQEGCKGRFWQVEKLLECGLNNRSFRIYNKKIIEIQNVKNKYLGYGVFNVYINNYLGILEKYCSAGILTKEDIKREERRLLFGYFADHFINLMLTPKRYDNNGWNDANIFLKKYVTKLYFMAFPLIILINIAKRINRNILVGGK